MRMLSITFHLHWRQVPVFLLLLLTACATPGPAGSPDLYSSSQNSRATADAALQHAYYQEQFLTASAQARIGHIPETAEAMAIQQQWWPSTAQGGQSTERAAMTQTAMSWPATPMPR